MHHLDHFNTSSSYASTSPRPTFILQLLMKKEGTLGIKEISWANGFFKGVEHTRVEVSMNHTFPPPGDCDWNVSKKMNKASSEAGGWPYRDELIDVDGRKATGHENIKKQLYPIGNARLFSRRR